jgi:hypothetical protein
LVAAIAAWVVGDAAMAAMPYGSLEFVEPEATVGAHDQIDVVLRLTIDPLSPDLVLSSGSLAGFDQADLPTQGAYLNPETGKGEVQDFAAITGVYLSLGFGCTDTFTGGCNRDTTNYSYSFFLNSEPGKAAIGLRRDFELAAGDSFDFVFAQFTPTEAGAQPGTYVFRSASLRLTFEGVDDQGHKLKSSYFPLAETSDTTRFTRVVAVPEPGTFTMAAIGLAALCASLARRRTHRD